MADSRIKKLIAGIYEKTRKGEFAWKKTSEERVFGISFSQHSIQIAMKWVFDEDFGEETQSYKIRILDESGELIEEISPSDFDDKDFALHPYLIFQEIYESARRYGMGLNSAVDSILKELYGSEDNIPF